MTFVRQETEDRGEKETRRNGSSLKGKIFHAGERRGGGGNYPRPYDEERRKNGLDWEGYHLGICSRKGRRSLAFAGTGEKEEGCDQPEKNHTDLLSTGIKLPVSIVSKGEEEERKAALPKKRGEDTVWAAKENSFAGKRETHRWRMREQEGKDFNRYGKGRMHRSRLKENVPPGFLSRKIGHFCIGTPGRGRNGGQTRGKKRSLRRSVPRSTRGREN